MKNIESKIPAFANNKQTPHLAAISLIAGVFSSFIVHLLGGIVAVITGLLAKREIKHCEGKLAGEKYVHWGIVLGLANIGLTIFCRLRELNNKS